MAYIMLSQPKMDVALPRMLNGILEHPNLGAIMLSARDNYNYRTPLR